MFVLGLITCVVLRAFSAQAKVVHSFNECDEFFYLGTKPRGMDQNAKKICQKLENRGFYYATLYSVHHKIPLYSAYTLDPRCPSDTERKDIWQLEPQISHPRSQTDHMVREDQITQNLYKENQAITISSDYSDTRYDRGHLNPNSFQCGDGRTVTFTLTNAAPMKDRFYRVHWNRWERTLRGYLLKEFVRDGPATAFIVTGTVPDPNVWIPQRETSKDPERVSVPSHIWTAVCYKDSDDSISFSFGYIGRNQQEEPDIDLMSLSRTPQSIRIFADDCFGDNNKLNKVMEAFQKLINLQVNKADQMSSGMRDTYLVVKRTFSSDRKIAFDSMSTYYKVAEDVNDFTGSTCLITKANGSLCSSVSESDNSCQCNTGGETKPCCSSPCFIDQLSSYWCYSGQTLEWCSPRYSLITYNGKRCLDDHPCATYGYDYYWCWNSKTKKGKYCRSNHACAKYDYNYIWYYTDDKGNWDYCCRNCSHTTSAGPFLQWSLCECPTSGPERLWCPGT
uniref:Uncharacterized protein n=1 Tax=Sinocyclocheilus rhinocerous TaxID=307959 RepID=A0A673JTD3_9TELE